MERTGVVDYWSDGVLEWPPESAAVASPLTAWLHSVTPELLQLLNSYLFHPFICSSAKALRSSALTSETAQNTNPLFSQCDTL